MSVFKAYDVRGTYPDQLDEALAQRLGAAFVHLVGARSLAVGRDMRAMAPSVAAAFIAGARRAGADVIDIGLASTPMTYFAIGSLGVDGGAQVTASHNPAGYIGFKFCRKGCVPVSGDTGIYELERMVARPEPVGAPREGTVTHRDVMDAYVAHVQRFAEGIAPTRIVVDTANGMGGHALRRVLAGLPIQCDVLFEELDGTFPNHEADPIKEENLQWVAREVVSRGADLGVAFDGDADRVVFVDGQGSPVRADFVTAAFAQDFLVREPGSAIVYDLRSSRATRDAIQEAGGRPIRERVGHSFIKARMREQDALMGGELSGHYYFRDNYVSDSGDIAMVTMLSILGRRACTVAELVSPFQRYHATGEINFKVADPDAALRSVEAEFPDGEIDHLDGVTVQYADWWFNVRKSNTEPLVRLNLEANTPELRDQRRTFIEEILTAR